MANATAICTFWTPPPFPNQSWLRPGIKRELNLNNGLLPAAVEDTWSRDSCQNEAATECRVRSGDDVTHPRCSYPPPHLGGCLIFRSIVAYIFQTSIILFNISKISSLSGTIKMQTLSIHISGAFKVDTGLHATTDVVARNPEVESGGSWRPRDCKSRQMVAILVPYRDRLDDLRLFLPNLHGFLKRQLIHYTIFLIEQVGLTRPSIAYTQNTHFSFIFLFFPSLFSPN